MSKSPTHFKPTVSDVASSPPPFLGWKVLTPCSRISQLVNNLAMVWSDGKRSTWPKVQEMFTHLKSPPRIHTEKYRRDDGFYGDVTFIRWVWDTTEYFWAFVEADDGDEGYLAGPDDIKGSPDPSFYDTESYPLTCYNKRWTNLPVSPSWETIDTFVEHLLNLQTVKHDDELSDDLVEVIAVNVCNAITQMHFKRHIYDLVDAEKVLDVIPEQYWPLFLCWVDRHLYSV